MVEIFAATINAVVLRILLEEVILIQCKDSEGPAFPIDLLPFTDSPIVVKNWKLHYPVATDLMKSTSSTPLEVRTVAMKKATAAAPDKTVLTKPATSKRFLEKSSLLY